MTNQTLNTLVIGRNGDPSSSNSYGVELAHRLPALLALYQEYCAIELDQFRLGNEFHGFISRGGQIHYVLGPDGQDSLLGFATVLGSCSLLENTFPVERFIIEAGLSHDLRQRVATALLESIINRAEAELPRRHDEIWVRVAFPVGADSLEANQPLYTALEVQGFQASRTPGVIAWIKWIRRSALAANMAA